MKNTYFVLYNRDRSGEQTEKAKGRMLYNKIKEYGSKEEAIAFGLSNLQDTPIVAKAVRTPGDYDLQANYIIAAYFPHKYGGYCYDEFISSPRYEVEKCDQTKLDEIIEKLASESPSKMRLGIEEKLMPTALDRIRDVNQQ